MTVSRLLCAAMAAATLAISGAGAEDDPAQDPALGTWQDRVLIEQTLERYIRGFDANDPQMFASAFAEDGVFQYNDDTFTGRAQIAKFIADRNAGRAAREKAGQSDPSARLFHVMSNSIITFDGSDKAHHSAYGVTVGRTTKETHLSSSGSYEDDLVKRNGEWLIQHRRLEQLPLFVPPPPPGEERK